MNLTVALYWWFCVLFGLWYSRDRRKRGKSFTQRDWEFPAFFFCLAIVPWYWPLMLCYLIGEAKAKKKAELEEFKRKNG